jgi:hypothetical protein
MVIGTLKEHIANIGNDCITEFNRVSLPVYDIRDDIPDNFLSILETVGMRSATDGLVVPNGNPRYANGSVSTLHPKMLASSLALSLSILMGTSVVLWKFT